MFYFSIALDIDLGAAFSLLGTLQLALRHPEFPKKPTGKWARGFAEELQKRIVEKAPELAFICEAGWHCRFDR